MHPVFASMLTRVAPFGLQNSQEGQLHAAGPPALAASGVCGAIIGCLKVAWSGVWPDVGTRAAVKCMCRSGSVQHPFEQS
jgi:hypothetical protein